MDLEFILKKAIFFKENGLITKELKVMRWLKQDCIKDLSLMINDKEMDNIFGIMDSTILETGKKEKRMDRDFGKRKMEIVI